MFRLSHNKGQDNPWIGTTVEMLFNQLSAPTNVVLHRPGGREVLAESSTICKEQLSVGAHVLSLLFFDTAHTEHGVYCQLRVGISWALYIYTARKLFSLSQHCLVIDSLLFLMILTLSRLAQAALL